MLILIDASFMTSISTFIKTNSHNITNSQIFFMKQFLPKITLALLAVFTTTFSASAQINSSQNWTKANAEKWFKSRIWASGMKLNVSETVDKQEFARQYTANKAYWDKAFAYFRDTDLEKVAVGKHVLDSESITAKVQSVQKDVEVIGIQPNSGHVTVAITENPTKAFEQTNWESHQKNIDVQYVSVGAEKMGIVKIADAKVIEAYNPAKDVAHYQAEGKFYEARPGTIFIFFPDDVHRVNVKVEGIEKDKKVVIKVPVAP
jgi:YhcH/YjgK/YiaL family protein